MVDRAKICLTSSLITMQNLVVASRAGCAHVGSPNFFPVPRVFNTLADWVPLGYLYSPMGSEELER